MNTRTHKPYKEFKLEQLKDRAFLEAYFEAIITDFAQDRNFPLLVAELRDIMQVEGAIEHIAETARIPVSAFKDMVAEDYKISYEFKVGEDGGRKFVPAIPDFFYNVSDPHWNQNHQNHRCA